MTLNKKISNGFCLDLFAGIPVKNYEESLEWYQRLFGCPPSFYPNDIEAVWQLSQHQWIYIIEQPEHSGGAVNTILGSSLAELDVLVEQISSRGIEIGKEELPEKNTRKIMYYDPDGNEIGFASYTVEQIKF
jgi:catechol 2,3-dioxygenase-like lactoylglutathione lyase family enzyme